MKTQLYHMLFFFSFCFFFSPFLVSVARGHGWLSDSLNTCSEILAVKYEPVKHVQI